MAQVSRSATGETYPAGYAERMKVRQKSGLVIHVGGYYSPHRSGSSAPGQYGATSCRASPAYTLTRQRQSFVWSLAV